MKIYFLQAECRDNAIKIGHTIRTGKQRLEDIRNYCPVPVKLLGEIDGGHWQEKWLHFRYKDFRLHGEWFIGDPVLMDEIHKFLSGRYRLPELPKGTSHIEMKKEDWKDLEVVKAIPNDWILEPKKVSENAGQLTP